MRTSTVPLNATDDMLTRYVEMFHDTLREVSARFFSGEQSKQLLHNSLLPAQITCYVSTQFGVGFEYLATPETKIEIAHGSARVEDLFVQAPTRLRNIGPMFNISTPGVQIGRLSLADGFPFRLTTEEANVIFWDVLFASDTLNWKRSVQYAEIYGDRRALRWTIEGAQNRAKDEVLAALVLAQRAERIKKPLNEYLSAFKEKTVLVLGSYDPEGEKRLEAIAAALKDIGYEPMLVRDIPDFEHYDLSQKVVAIGAVARFIVVDDSSPSGHLAELELCRLNRWGMVILRAHGTGSSWMTAGASLSSNVIHETSYDPENTRPTLEEAAKWAEDRLGGLKEQLGGLYPWRMKS